MGQKPAKPHYAYYRLFPTDVKSFGKNSKMQEILLFYAYYKKTQRFACKIEWDYAIVAKKGGGSMKEIQLLWVHSSQMMPGTAVKNHSHDYFHLIHVTDGRLRFVLADREMDLNAGDMVIVPQGKIHRFSNESAAMVCFHEVKFAVQGQGLPRLLAQDAPFVIRDSFAQKLVSQAAAEYAQNRAMKEEAAQAAISTLVLHLTAQARSLDQQTPGLIDTTGFNKLSCRVIGFLTDHYWENLSLDDISAGVEITKNYLCNAFKLNTGITIIDCLNMIRIRKAAEQIVYSDLPLAEVAQMCGYVSASHFNRVFMRYVGMPPGQCRRAYAYDVAGENARIPGSFISCVLAGKPISQEMLRGFEESQ